MKTAQIIAVLIAIGVIALALGASIGYGMSSARTSTITQTQKPLTTTETYTVTYSLVSAITTPMCCVNTSSASTQNLFNEIIQVYVNYNSAWGLSYQTHLGTNPTSGVVLESGNFFGHTPANESVTIVENNTLLDNYGFITCFQAQKLDNSSSMLVLGFTSSNSQNQTSSPFGSVRLCVANIYSPTANYSSDVACTDTYYQGGVAEVSLSVENTTTLTLTTIPTTLTRVDTFTTITNTAESIGYVTTYNEYVAPSTNVIEVCTFIG